MLVDVVPQHLGARHLDVLALRARGTVLNLRTTTSQKCKAVPYHSTLGSRVIKKKKRSILARGIFMFLP